MAKGRPLVLTADAEPPGRIDALRRALGGIAEVSSLPTERAARHRSLAQARAIVVFAWKIADDELELLGDVGLVQSVWAGVDRIPVARLAARHPRVRFATGSGPNAAQTAEHAVALYLDCAKRVSLRDRAMRAGRWLQETPSGRVAGSRIAVLGYGAVGRHVGRMLGAMGAEVVAGTRDGRTHDGTAGATLDGLRADAVAYGGWVIALPLTRSTEGLIDAGWLGSMRKDAILVNVARGRIVDEDALFEHLAAHPGFQAGLDVWWDYPRGDGPFAPRRPFGTLDNVVMTPHSAFHVPGTRDEMLAGAAANVARWLSGSDPQHVVDPAEY